MQNYLKSKLNFNNLMTLKYNFKKMNKDIDIKKIVDDIGVLKYGYLNILQMTADSKNRINFDLIDLSESNIRGLIAFFKRKGFIGKFKLKGDSVKTYYLNPLYSHQGKTISIELYNAFDGINNKIY